RRSAFHHSRGWASGMLSVVLAGSSDSGWPLGEAGLPLPAAGGVGTAAPAAGSLGAGMLGAGVTTGKIVDGAAPGLAAPPTSVTEPGFHAAGQVAPRWLRVGCSQAARARAA